jgi:hypothetical protein
MASLLGDTVAANYLKASPSTQFGTRVLRIVKVATGTDTYGSGVATYGAANSDYAKAVRTIQTYFETWAVFAPVAGGFCFICSDDTAQDSDASTNVIGGYGQAEAAVIAAIGSTCTISTVTTLYPGQTV